MGSTAQNQSLALHFVELALGSHHHTVKNDYVEKLREGKPRTNVKCCSAKEKHYNRPSYVTCWALSTASSEPLKFCNAYYRLQAEGVLEYGVEENIWT